MKVDHPTDFVDSCDRKQFFNDRYHHYVKFDDIARVSRIRNFAKILEFYFCKKSLRNSRKYYRDFPDELRKNLAVQFTAIRIDMDPKLGKLLPKSLKKRKRRPKLIKRRTSGSLVVRRLKLLLVALTVCTKQM